MRPSALLTAPPVVGAERHPSSASGWLATYLWLVGNGGMGYNYNYYYYHSSYRSLLMNPIDPFKGTLNIPYYYHSSIPD